MGYEGVCQHFGLQRVPPKLIPPLRTARSPIPSTTKFLLLNNMAPVSVSSPHPLCLSFRQAHNRAKLAFHRIAINTFAKSAEVSHAQVGVRQAWVESSQAKQVGTRLGSATLGLNFSS